MKESISAQDDAAEIVRRLRCSDLRKNLTLTLNKGPASLADLCERLDVSSTAAIHALRELAKEYLTSQDDKRNYALINVGRIGAMKLEDLIKVANVMAGQKIENRLLITSNQDGYLK